MICSLTLIMTSPSGLVISLAELTIRSTSVMLNTPFTAPTSFLLWLALTKNFLRIQLKRWCKLKSRWWMLLVLYNIMMPLLELLNSTSQMITRNAYMMELKLLKKSMLKLSTKLQVSLVLMRKAGHGVNDRTAPGGTVQLLTGLRIQIWIWLLPLTTLLVFPSVSLRSKSLTTTSLSKSKMLVASGLLQMMLQWSAIVGKKQIIPIMLMK